MNKLIAIILISSQAFAGLPPPTVKSQSDSTAKTKFQIQAPHNQFTDLGGVKTLIETGNGNILPDPGFEALTSGWTASGGATATANSTAKGTGAKGYDWDSNSAGQTLTSSSVTIPAGLAGKNGIAYCNIKTVSGTATHTFTVNDGTNDIVTPITIQSSTTSFAGQNEGNKINFVFPSSGTIRIKLASVNANEPEIYIDDCSISLANNVYDAPLVTAWTSYTPTFTGFGTVSTQSFQWRRNGSNLEIRGRFTTGTVTATEARLSFPSGLTSSSTIVTLESADGTVLKDSGASTTSFANSPLIEPSVTYFTFGFNTSTSPSLSKVNGNVGFANAQVVSVTAKSPILGWSAVSAVSADQTDYDWTSYTPTFTGFGTVTSPECQHSRVASNLLLRCKFVSGTSTATEARISLPNSLSVADTSKVPSLQIAGYGAKSGVSASDFGIRPPLIAAGNSYFTVGRQTSGTAAFVSGNGSDVVSNGDTIQFNASIPIQGWSSNQRAPTLVGSVTSNSSSAMRDEAAILSCGASSSINTQYNAGWISSIGNASGGNCVVTLPSGTFSAIPACFISSNDVPPSGEQDVYTASATSTTSITITQRWQASGSTTINNGNNYSVNLLCRGPR